MITIGSASVRTPSEMRPSFVDVQKVERSAAGTAVIDRLARKRRVNMSWQYLTNAQLSSIQTAIAPVTFTFIYPESGGANTITAFVTLFETGLQLYAGSAAVGWQDTKLEVEEV